MASTFEAYPEGSSISGLVYTTTTLAQPLTTVLTSVSVYDDDKSTTVHIATVIPAGTVIVNELAKGGRSKKTNTTVIVAAAVGGFAVLVLFGLAIYLIRRRDKRRRAQIIPPSPSTLYAPSIAPVSITPYNGHQSPTTVQPYQQRPLTTVSDASNVAHYAQPIISEKTRNRMMLHNPDRHGGIINHLHPPDQTSRPSIDNTGSSVLSQPYTMSSVYSTATGTGPLLQNTQGLGPQPVHKQRYPQDQYHYQPQRTGSTTSQMSGMADARNGGPSPIPPSTPGQASTTQASSHHDQTAGRNPMVMGAGPTQGHPVAQQPPNTTYVQASMSGRSNSANASTPGATGHPQSRVEYPQQHPYQNHQGRSFNPHHIQGSSGSGVAYESGPSSSANVPGGLAIVDRGAGGGEQVYTAKNAPPSSRRTDGVEDVEERATSLSELPPTYDSIPNRATGASG